MNANRKSSNRHAVADSSALQSVPQGSRRQSHGRRRSSIVENLQEALNPSPPVVNPPAAKTKEEEVAAKKKNEMEKYVRELAQTSRVGSGTGKDDVEKRRKVIDGLLTSLSSEDVGKVLEKLLTKIDDQADETNEQILNAISHLSVGLFSMADLYSDLYCLYVVSFVQSPQPFFLL